MVRKPPFGERIGVVQPPTPQLEKPNNELRIRLWNVFLEHIGNAGLSPGFVKSVWRDVLVYPLDQLLEPVEPRWRQFRDLFMSADWVELYAIVEHAGRETPARAKLQEALEQGSSGYHFIGENLAPITNEQEISEIEIALSNPVVAARTHLKSALRLFSQRPVPDCRNSMKESISAIESIVGVVTNRPGETLGKTIKSLGESLGQNFPSSLVAAFDKLYGFTSNSSGIRHALIDAESVGPEDARWMLVTCSAFVNFLVTKSAKASILLD